MRGVAALAVAIGHIVHNNNRIISSDWLWALIEGATRYGYLGVNVFFVISGFVLPYVMITSRYQEVDAGRFLLKRLARLHPPYLISLALFTTVSVAAAAAPGFLGPQPDFTTTAILSNAFYVAPWFGEEWINPVFWSLCVEVQYYIVLAALLPAALRLPQAAMLAVLIALAAMPWLGRVWDSLHYHLPFFIVGFSIALWTTGRLSGPLTLVCVAATICFVFLQHDLPYALVTLASAGALLLRNCRPAALLWVGMISYSLYLTHYIVGLKMLRLSARYAQNDAMALCAYALALLVSIGAAIAFYFIAERPALLLSRLVRSRRAEPAHISIGRTTD
jgi:peptidoglycan/LPS O-acetylase OafA/YrhL